MVRCGGADGCGYAVTWTSRDAGGTGGGLYAQRFDRAGVRVGGEALVGTFGILYDKLGYQLHAIAGLAEGGYVVTWTYDHIYAQRVDAAGSRVGDAAVVAATGENSQVAALSDGGYVVTWDDIFAASAMTDIAAQRFDRAGGRLGGQLGVNSYAPYVQRAPAVAGLADGGYVLTWVNAHRIGGSDIHMQRFDASNLRR